MTVLEFFTLVLSAFILFPIWLFIIMFVGVQGFLCGAAAFTRKVTKNVNESDK